MVRVQIPLKVIDRQLVAALKLSIVFRIHLNRVVRQVDVARVQVVQVELLRGRSEVAVAVHVSLHHAIDRREQGVTPDIELSVVNEQGLVEVLLHDRRPVAILRRQLLNQISDLVERTGDLDACASIRVLARLDDPNVVVLLLRELLVGLGEPDVLGVVIVRLLDVEGERDGHLEGVDPHRLVVRANVEEERLLIRQVVVVVQAVVDQSRHDSKGRVLQLAGVDWRSSYLFLLCAFARRILGPAHDLVVPPLLVLVFGDALQELVVLSLAPLSPDEMAAARKLLVRQNLVLSNPVMLARYQVVSVVPLRPLPIKFLLLLVASVPPRPPADYLAHRRVVITLANIESEDLS